MNCRYDKSMQKCCYDLKMIPFFWSRCCWYFNSGSVLELHGFYRAKSIENQRNSFFVAKRTQVLQRLVGVSDVRTEEKKKWICWTFHNQFNAFSFPHGFFFLWLWRCARAFLCSVAFRQHTKLNSMTKSLVFFSSIISTLCYRWRCRFSYDTMAEAMRGGQRRVNRFHCTNEHLVRRD